MARLPARLAALLGAGDLVHGFDAPGAATFILSLEPGTKITYSWSTSIITSYAGLEQRESPFGQPRRRIEGAAFLIDGPQRDVKGAMMRAAARGTPFSVGLPFEELVITADSTGTAIAVGSTALCDWAIPGQRVAIVGSDGTVVLAVVQATSPTAIDVAPVDTGGVPTGAGVGAPGRAGGRIMPVVPMLLEPQQGFARYVVTVGLWALRALAASFGFAGTDSMGVGANILTVNDGLYIPAAELTDDDLMIWDRPNFMAETANETMASRTEIVDFGALAFSAGAANTPDWGRSIRYASHDPAELQWLKAFLWRARGRQVAFLLSTNRPDFVFDSVVSGGFKISSEGDYVSWFVSSAHRRLALTSSSGITYVSIAAITDNLDGTLSLETTAATVIPEDVTRVSMLEQVRFDSDDLAVTWDSGVFTFEQGVVTVQDSIAGASRSPFLFDTVVNTESFTLPAPTGVKHISAVLGTTTLVRVISDRSFTISGVTNTGPGGNQDGMVICVLDVMNGTGGGCTFQNEETSSAATSRFRGRASPDGYGSLNQAVWYRYHGAIQRWLAFATNTR